MKTIEGNLIQFALDGKFDVIIHGCNCFNTMGSGIAKTIKNVFPEALEADARTIYGDKNKLGSFSLTKVINNNDNIIIIVNAYTQYKYGRDKVYADYNAIKKVFIEIQKTFHGLRIGYPYIGAGLAGGDWNIISKIIDEQLEEEDHTLVIFK